MSIKDKFESMWCNKCQKDYTYRKTGKGSGCKILMDVMVLDHIPKEWQEQEETCQSFQKIKPKELRNFKKKKKSDPKQRKLF